MTTRIRFLTNFYAVNGAGTSYTKYQVGKDYPVNEETQRLTEAGLAELIEIEEQTEAPSAPSNDAPATDQPA